MTKITYKRKENIHIYIKEVIIIYIIYNKNNLNDLIKKRYVFDGYLKIPVEIIHSLSDKDKDIVNILFGHFKEKALKYFIMDKQKCISYPLSPNRTLYIDYANNHLNFYIKDIKNKEITQTLILSDINKIIRAEQVIYKTIQNANNNDKIQNGKDNLTSVLVRTAYYCKIHNSGSPTIEQCKLNDDITLDI